MKKIGILTFHRANNYGAVLQNYALQQALINLAVEVETIDYRCNDIENAYKLEFSKQNKKFLKKIKSYLYYLINYHIKKSASKNLINSV